MIKAVHILYAVIAAGAADVIHHLEQEGANSALLRWPVVVVTYNISKFDARRQLMQQQLAPRKVTFIDMSNSSPDPMLILKHDKHIPLDREQGVFMSHLEAYRIAVRDQPPGGGVLIFEDDAILAANWEPILANATRGFPVPPEVRTLLIKDPRKGNLTQQLIKGNSTQQLIKRNLTQQPRLSSYKKCKDQEPRPVKECTWPVHPSAIFFGTCLNIAPDLFDKCIGCGACIRVPGYHKHPGARPLSRCTHAYAIEHGCAKVLLDSFAGGSSRGFTAIDRWLNYALRNCTVLWTRVSLASQASMSAGVVPLPERLDLSCSQSAPHGWRTALSPRAHQVIVRHVHHLSNQSMNQSVKQSSSHNSKTRSSASSARLCASELHGRGFDAACTGSTSSPSTSSIPPLSSAKASATERSATQLFTFDMEAERVLDVHVLTWTRPDSFAVLWASLKRTLPPQSMSVLCTVHQDGMPSDAKNGTTVDRMWKQQRSMLLELNELHGQQVRRDLQVRSRGLKYSVLSITPLPRSAGFILLEDDLEVSPLLFRYAEAYSQRYTTLSTDPDASLPTIIGVNLFTLKADDMTKVPPRPLHIPAGPFATAVPTSWGAQYLGDSFARFQQWVLDKHGIDSPITLPAELTAAKGWPSKNSWKKYLVKFMLAHSLHMVGVQFGNGTLVINQGVAGVHFKQKIAHQTKWLLKPYPLLDASSLPHLERAQLDPTAVWHAPEFDIRHLDVYDMAWRHVRESRGNRSTEHKVSNKAPGL